MPSVLTKSTLSPGMPSDSLEMTISGVGFQNDAGNLDVVGLARGSIGAARRAPYCASAGVAAQRPATRHRLTANRRVRMNRSRPGLVYRKSRG